VSPRKLDSDGVVHAFKAHRDQIAAELGLDDGSEQWTWEYRQERGAPGIRIEQVPAVARLAWEALR
jgi:hypothetical protein